MNKPRIVCAANKYLIQYSPDDVPREFILAGARHWDTVMHVVWESLDEYLISCIDRNTEEQGFIDQFGNFYNRKDAYIVAKENGQIIRDLDGVGVDTLFSEHLY